MSDANDSSFEMHNDSLSPEEVEHLIDGMSVRPDLAELATLLDEVRALPKNTATPAVSAALAEFIGVGLTPTPEPLVLDSIDTTPVLDLSEEGEAVSVRRKSMIGQAAVFLGTLGGKVAVGTTVAAASLGGAHAVGVVDVPYLPDNKPAVIETIEVPEDPDAMAFVEDLVDVDEIEATEKDEVAGEPTDEVKKSDKVEDDLPPRFGDKTEAKTKAEIEAEAEAKAEIEAEEAKKAEEAKVEEAKAQEAAKAEEKKTEPKKEKTTAEIAKLDQIGALDEAMHKAKDKARADATALIKPLEQERDALLADLAAAKKALAEQYEPVIASLVAELEGTVDPGERAAIESDIDAAEAAWIAGKAAAELEVEPRLAEIDDLFHTIETERDEELNRIVTEFFAAVEAIEKS